MPDKSSRDAFDFAFFFDRMLQTHMPVKLPPDCVIKFTATWCGPCKAIAPFVDEICQKYNVPLVVVDVDEDEETSRRFKVKAMPSLVFLADGA